MKKISIIFSFLFMFVLLFTSLIHAAETEYPEIPISSGWKYSNYIVYEKDGVITAKVFTSDTSFDNSKIFIVESNTLRLDFLSSSFTYCHYIYTLENNVWKKGANGAVTTSHNFSYDTLIESTVDIYNSKDSEEIFFPLTPQVTQKQTILAPIVEETETQKTLAEVVGIIPLIIVVVVSLVGLRKALKMLSALLHRS